MTQAHCLSYKKMGSQVGFVYNKLFHNPRDGKTEGYQITAIKTIIFR